MDPIAINFTDTQFLIPFLFTLAVVFGVLELSKIFRGNKAVSLIISFAIALFAAGYAPFQTTLWNFLPSVTWFFIVLFLIAFGLELFGARKLVAGAGGHEGMIVNGAVLLILLSVGWGVIQRFPINLPYIGGGQNLIFLIGLLLIISLFWAAMRTGFSGGERQAS